MTFVRIWVMIVVEQEGGKIQPNSARARGLASEILIITTSQFN